VSVATRPIDVIEYMHIDGRMASDSLLAVFLGFCNINLCVKCEEKIRKGKYVHKKQGVWILFYMLIAISKDSVHCKVDHFNLWNVVNKNNHFLH